jgi:hypothetical protein
MAVLVVAGLVGLHRDRDPATLNNVAFTALHLTVLSVGIRPALRRADASSTNRDVEKVEAAA